MHIRARKTYSKSNCKKNIGLRRNTTSDGKILLPPYKSPKLSDMDKLWKLINLLASEICADYERAAPKCGPRVRPIARFSVATSFLAFLVLAIALILSRQSQIRTERHFRDLKRLADLSSKENATCPCAGSVYINWTNHISFYMLSRTDSGKQMSVLINEDVMDSFCNTFGMQTRSGACKTSMQYCFGERTPKSLSQNLVVPAVFLEMLISAVQGTCSNKLFYLKLLLRTEALMNNVTGPSADVQECRGDECKYEPLMRSLFSVLQAFKVDPYNRTDEYYWEAPSKFYPKPSDPTLRNITFKMAANYTSYLETCNPRYCDLVTYIKIWQRIMLSVAQIGGVLTIALAGLRLLIWPFLVWLFALDKEPTCFSDMQHTNKT